MKYSINISSFSISSPFNLCGALTSCGRSVCSLLPKSSVDSNNIASSCKDRTSFLTRSINFLTLLDAVEGSKAYVKFMLVTIPAL